MTKWLEWASQWHEMYCYDLEVMGSNPWLIRTWDAEYLVILAQKISIWLNLLTSSPLLVGNNWKNSSATIQATFVHWCNWIVWFSMGKSAVTLGSNPVNELCEMPTHQAIQLSPWHYITSSLPPQTRQSFLPKPTITHAVLHIQETNWVHFCFSG